MINIYVANLGKYNEGYLLGKWVELPMSESEKEAMFVQIGLGYYDEAGEYVHGLEVDGEIYEEWAIHDYETDIEGLKISEYSSIDNLNELAEKLENMRDWEVDEVKAVMAATSYDLEECIEIVEDGRCTVLSGVSTTEELGWYVIDNGLFGYTIPDALMNYIDVEAIGSDWEMDYTIIPSLEVAVRVD